eukprot:1139948-Pelagomonas_calceolata.AAC.2
MGHLTTRFENYSCNERQGGPKSIEGCRQLGLHSFFRPPPPWLSRATGKQQRAKFQQQQQQQQSKGHLREKEQGKSKRKRGRGERVVQSRKTAGMI